MTAQQGELLLQRGRPVPASSDADCGERVDAPPSLVFEQLMTQHEGMVLRLALRILGNRDDALDAAQEVFISLFRGLDKLDPARPVEPWLYRVTMNACRDIAKKRKLWWSAPARTAEPTVENNAARNHDAAIETQIVAEGLKRLSARERAAGIGSRTVQHHQLRAARHGHHPRARRQ